MLGLASRAWKGGCGVLRLAQGSWDQKWGGPVLRTVLAGCWPVVASEQSQAARGGRGKPPAPARHPCSLWELDAQTQVAGVSVG